MVDISTGPTFSPILCSQCETVLSSDLVRSRNFLQLTLSSLSGEADVMMQGVYQIINQVPNITYVFCSEKCVKKWSSNLFRNFVISRKQGVIYEVIKSANILSDLDLSVVAP